MNQPYRSSDLALSAFLSTQKVQQLGVERKDNRSLWFLFAPFDKCSELATEFFSGRAKVSAREYATALKLCKDQVFQKLRELESAEVAQ